MTFSDTSTFRYFLLAPLLLVLAATVSAGKVNLKINLGGPQVDGFSGEEEILHLGEEAVKTRYHGSITGHGNDLQVFKTQRFARDEDLVINIPVPNGIYSVTLMFAETWEGAFNAGKRVFDVYLGSKPGGVVKVAESFDPFRSGGPAGPVRRKYDQIATYDGLTVALRPIEQNPQIAGIVVSGFSYSESFIDELPTVAGDPSEVEDFSVLNSIAPKLPVDPLMIYDPNLNPKFKVKKGSHVEAAKSRSPVQVSVPVGQTSVHAQQTSFTSSGPNADSSWTTIDLSAHKNSLLNRPASGSLSPQGSPLLHGLRSGTVRAVANNGSLYLPHSAQHDLEASSSSLPASHRLRRHGRRLASIPVQAEDQPLLYGRDSRESTRPDQFHPALSYLNHAPSTTLSEPAFQDSSPQSFASYQAGLRTQENEQTQALGNTQAERFAENSNAGSSLELAQQDPRSMNRNPDPYSQSNIESDQVIQQARSESFQVAPHLVSQTESSVQPSKPDSEVSPAGSAPLSAGMMKTPVHVSNLGAKLKKTYPGSLTGQENDGQSFQPPSEGGYRMNSAGNVQGIPAQGRAPFQTESIDSRKEAPTLQNRESSSSRNAVIDNGVASYLKPAGNIEPSESPTGVQAQRDLRAIESVRSSQTGQQRSAIWSDSHHLGSAESSSLADAPIRAVALTSYQVKMATERQNEVRNYKRNIMSQPNVGSTTQAGHNVNTATNPDIYIRQDRQMKEMRRGERDPATSTQSLRIPSGGQDLDSARSSSFRNTNFKAESSSMTDAMSPGVHNGIGRLDGLCIDNSTHCSCGMVEQRRDAQEECLFVTDESSNPMACTIRPCNGKVICACAPGASGLCQRSLVKNILVRAPTSEATEIGAESVIHIDKTHDIFSGIMPAPAAGCKSSL